MVSLPIIQAEAIANKALAIAPHCEMAMIAVPFPEANAVLGKEQNEYEPISAYIFRDGRVACCFRLSDDEIATIVKTRTIWMQQLTFGNAFHPIALSTQRPHDLPVKRDIQIGDICEFVYGQPGNDKTYVLVEKIEGDVAQCHDVTFFNIDCKVPLDKLRLMSDHEIDAFSFVGDVYPNGRATLKELADKARKERLPKDGI